MRRPFRIVLPVLSVLAVVPLAGQITSNPIPAPIEKRGLAVQIKDVTRLPAHRRALLGIGYSPEDAGIFPDLTVAENFRISQSLARAGGRPVGATGADGIDARVFALFPEVQGFLQRRGLFLSGGQKKVVAQQTASIAADPNRQAVMPPT